MMTVINDHADPIKSIYLIDGYECTSSLSPKLLEFLANSKRS